MAIIQVPNIKVRKNGAWHDFKIRANGTWHDNYYIRKNGVWYKKQTAPPITLPTPTFIIDSDQKLSDLVNQVAGNDYTHVLVKTGSYSKSISSTVRGNNFINNGVTKTIVGENGARLEFNYTNIYSRYTVYRCNGILLNAGDPDTLLYNLTIVCNTIPSDPNAQYVVISKFVSANRVIVCDIVINTENAGTTDYIVSAHLIQNCRIKGRWLKGRIFHPASSTSQIINTKVDARKESNSGNFSPNEYLQYFSVTDSKFISNGDQSNGDDIFSIPHGKGNRVLNRQYMSVYLSFYWGPDFN